MQENLEKYTPLEAVASDEFPDEAERRNAFQHAYWMALVTQQTGDPTNAQVLGYSHELDINNGPADTVKDLLNNQRGAIVGAATQNAEQARVLLVQAANEGLLVCLRGNVIEGC